MSSSNKKMKGVALDPSSYGGFGDSKARIKHQTLLQDYQDLQKVTFCVFSSYICIDLGFSLKFLLQMNLGLDYFNFVTKSTMTNQVLIDNGNRMMDETDQAIERLKKVGKLTRVSSLLLHLVKNLTTFGNAEKASTYLKLLFLKYEDLKRDPKGEVLKLASFLGRPLANDGEAEKIVRLCSIERLKNLEVNKDGVDPWSGFPKSSYFRLGLVGDWKNKLSTKMKDRLDKITRVKFEGSGLSV
ncbi:hypothetical protein LOK49_LG09G02302 [Camellia lanceoleosa]|uniref:Uncharacterized protein n=1 Tax=Camellia lanceoleosa TaxID=1840588 RepID=A0ACC0GHL4_9ERIC|nr:hypothetical protein LOK49_LG09G02302 [Camellia lanceoleosa]